MSKTRQPSTPDVDSAPAVDPADLSTDAIVDALTPSTPDAVAPADPAPAVDPVDTFLARYAVVVGEPSTSLDDPQSGVTDLTSLYRAIPAASRGRAVATAMANGMMSGADNDRNVNLSKLVTVAPARGSSAPVVDPVQVASDRIAALIIAAAMVDLGGADPGQVYQRLSVDLTPLAAGGVVDAAGWVLTFPADLASMSGRQVSVLTSADRAVRAVTRGTGTTSGPRGPITQRRADGITGSSARAHVDHCMSTVDVGTFLSTGAMAKLVSPAYPDPAARPSSGHLANVVRVRATGAPVTAPTWQGSSRPDGATRTA